MRLKLWQKVVQEDHIGKPWFYLQGAADTEKIRMILEASLADKINMTGLETSGNHLPYEFINVLLGLSLVPGGWAQITYETLHKGWSTLC